jgi:hypothetical protein
MHILKVPNTTNDIRREYRAKSETIQHITGACLALSQDDYTYRHNQLANFVLQKLAIKFGLSKGASMPYYKYGPQSVLRELQL